MLLQRLLLSASQRLQQGPRQPSQRCPREVGLSRRAPVEPHFPADSLVPPGVLLLLQVLLQHALSTAGNVSSSGGAAVPSGCSSAPSFLLPKGPLASKVVSARLPLLEFMETAGLPLGPPLALQQASSLSGVRLCWRLAVELPSDCFEGLCQAY